MAGKNVEDELGTVDDTPLNDLFNVALLRRAEIVIEEKNVGVRRSDRARDFLELTRTNQGRRSGRSRRCRISPTTVAPALSAKVRSSASDSSASNSGILGLPLDFGAPGCIAAASRATAACAVTTPFPA